MPMSCWNVCWPKNWTTLLMIIWMSRRRNTVNWQRTTVMLFGTRLVQTSQWPNNSPKPSIPVYNPWQIPSIKFKKSSLNWAVNWISQKRMLTIWSLCFQPLRITIRFFKFYPYNNIMFVFSQCPMWVLLLCVTNEKSFWSWSKDMKTNNINNQLWEPKSTQRNWSMTLIVWNSEFLKKFFVKNLRTLNRWID